MFRYRIVFVISLICFCSIVNCGRFGRDSYVNTESNGMKYVRSLESNGNFCVGKTNFDAMRLDSRALQLYATKVCTKVPKANALKYVADNYGVKGNILGSGSFGRVYKYQKGSDFYAIKVPKNFEYRALFEELNSSECIKDIVASSSLKDHFGLIIDCVWPIGKNPYLVMHYLPMTLGDKILSSYKNGWVSFDNRKKTRVVNDMIFIAREIEEIHLKGYAHRDLKSENIMVNQKGEPILVDFGLTTPKGEYSSTICGTPYYLDYEILRKSRNPMGSDIYSLSIIFVEMVEGRNFDANIKNMLKKGKYSESKKGLVTYSPKFVDLKVPNDWKWVEHMFKPLKDSRDTKNNRWSINMVIQKLNLVLKSLAAVDVPVQAKRSVSVLQKPKVEILNIPIAKDKNIQMVLAVSKDPSPNKIQKLNTPNREKYANPYLKPNTKVMFENKEYTREDIDNEIQQVLQRARDRKARDNLNGENIVMNHLRPSNKFDILQDYASKMNKVKKKRSVELDRYGKPINPNNQAKARNVKYSKYDINGRKIK